MVTNKRSKNTRQRGSNTHGWGAMKKHRGAGHRGGRGNAGTGKRGDAKKPRIWKNKKYFGKYGFTSKSRKDVKVINIAYIEEKLGKLVEKKLIEEKEGIFTIDLAKLGYTKLLGYGKPTKKYTVINGEASGSAVEKIQAAGGSVIGAEAAEETEPKEGESSQTSSEAESKEGNNPQSSSETETKKEVK